MVKRAAFIQQVEFELTQFNPLIKLENKSVEFTDNPAQPLTQEVPKDEAMLAGITYLSARKGTCIRRTSMT